MLLTLREIKSKTEKFFSEKGIPNEKLETDLILSHALNLKRLDLYLDLERPIYEKELNHMREMVRRRAMREPLQYILGESYFFNCSLRVDKRALIPRPETELLVEQILPLLQDAKHILELGTGSGAIVCALAKAGVAAEIIAVDRDTEALALAKSNADALALSEQITFLESDWLSAVSRENSFDMIISNPPYLSQELYDSAEPEVKEYEPKQALLSGDAGMSDFKIIMEQAYSFLKPEGYLVFETGTDQHAELSKEANRIGYHRIKTTQDLNGYDRFLWMQRPV
jgi:release factor glutamine methyltransferase